MRFQDGCEKYVTYNKITVVTVDKTPVKEEPKVPMIAVIPDEIVPLNKG